MSNLPHEVLLTIFEYLDDKVPRPSRGDKASPFLPLLAICRLWRVLVEPILYRRTVLDLCIGSITNRQQSQLIYNLQQQNVRIRYVKELTLIFPWEYSDEWQKFSSSAYGGLNLVQIVGWFIGHMEKLSLKGGYFEKLGQPLLLAIARLRPRSLILSGNWCYFLLDHLLFWGDSESLQSVTLEDFSSGNEDYPWSYHKKHRPHPRATDLLPLDRQYTSKLSTIKISLCSPFPNYPKNLLLWPTGLRSLALRTTITLPGSSLPWTSDNIQSLLNMHKDTLETIELGPFGMLRRRSTAGSIAPSMAIPELSSFPHLHTLKLEASNLLSETSQSANTKLAAPTLRHLIIGTKYHYNYSEPTRFNSESCAWLADFAKYKAEHYPLSNLRSIQVRLVVYDIPWPEPDFYGQYGPPTPPTDLGEPYPYTPLQQIKPTMKSLGIDISWPSPWLSEFEWDQRLSRAGGRGGWPEDWDSNTRYAYSDCMSTVSGCMECEKDSDCEDCNCDGCCDNDRDRFDTYEFAISTRPDATYEEGQRRICSWLLQSTECRHEKGLIAP